MEQQKPKQDDSMNFLRQRNLNPVDIIDPASIEWEPEPILAVDYYGMDEKHFLCSSLGNYLGYLYVCNFHEESPTERSF